MTDLDHRALDALLNCRLRLGSAGKRFLRELEYDRNQDRNYKLTRGQALYVWQLCYTYRRQIRDEEVLINAKIVRLTGSITEIYSDPDDLRESQRETFQRSLREEAKFKSGTPARKPNPERVI